MGLYNPSEIVQSATNNVEINSCNSYTVVIEVDWEEFLLENKDRKKVIIWNKGTNDVLISYGSLASFIGIDEGAFPLKAGGVFIDEYPAYVGIYKARTEQGTAILSIKELAEVINND